MKSKFETTNKCLEDIQKLLNEKELASQYSTRNSLWEHVFQGVLLIKDLELLKQQMEDILKLTLSLKENSVDT